MNRVNFDRLGAIWNKQASRTTPQGGPRKRFNARIAWLISGLLVASLVVYALFSGLGGRVGSASLPIIDTHDQTDINQPMPYPTPGTAASESGAGGGTYAQNSDGQKSAPGSNNTTSQPWDRMLIRTATLELTVSNVLSSVDAVMNVATLHGGRVLQMESHQVSDYSYSTVIIQVPSEEFDKVIPELHKLNGQVKKIGSENISSQDVTEEYTDLQSQLRNLQATESRLLALQQKADKLEDILSLDHELRDIQGQIEQITGRTNYLSKRSEMSQITIELSPEAAAPTPATEPQPAWDPGSIVSQAWEASLDLLSKLATVVLTVVVFLWWVVPVVLVLLWVSRRMGRPVVQTPSAGGNES